MKGKSHHYRRVDIGEYTDRVEREELLIAAAGRRNDDAIYREFERSKETLIAGNAARATQRCSIQPNSSRSRRPGATAAAAPCAARGRRRSSELRPCPDVDVVAQPYPAAIRQLRDGRRQRERARPLRRHVRRLGDGALGVVDRPRRADPDPGQIGDGRAGAGGRLLERCGDLLGHALWAAVLGRGVTGLTEHPVLAVDHNCLDSVSPRSIPPRNVSMGWEFRRPRPVMPVLRDG